MNQFFFHNFFYLHDNGIMETLCGSGIQFNLSLKDIVVHVCVYNCYNASGLVCILFSVLKILFCAVHCKFINFHHITIGWFITLLLTFIIL